jgi:DNA-binding transcriptional LysR family regulator
MEMRKLEALCRVIELRSFTKAAEALLLSQPTVSEHIKSLEDQLGERMIDRAGRDVAPTPAGKVFYQYARNILRLRDEALETLARFRGKLAGSLLIGAGTTPGAYVLPKCVAEFKEAYPEVHITLHISKSSEIAQGVLEGTYEAGVIGSSPGDKRIAMERLCEDELVLVTRPGRFWGDKRRIDRDDLARAPFVLRELGSGTRAVMNGILQKHGFDPARLSVVAEMGGAEAIRQAVKAGIGVSIITRRAVEEDIVQGTLTRVDVAGIRFVRPLFLIYRKNRVLSPACLEFLDHLRRCALGGDWALTKEHESN